MKKRKEKAHGCGKERGRLFTQSGTAQRCCEEKTTKQRTHTLVFFFLRFADFLFLRGPPPPLSFRRRLVFFFSFFLSFFSFRFLRLPYCLTSCERRSSRRAVSLHVYSGCCTTPQASCDKPRRLGGPHHPCRRRHLHIVGQLSSYPLYPLALHGIKIASPLLRSPLCATHLSLSLSLSLFFFFLSSFCCLLLNFLIHKNAKRRKKKKKKRTEKRRRTPTNLYYKHI